ncbi:MAG TPA: hypothetical protein ENN53_05330 [Candidatus Acetothermia bacterium]|nr:hypothetical protein [Candidatus Acetothermia bacterium]
MWGLPGPTAGPQPGSVAGSAARACPLSWPMPSPRNTGPLSASWISSTPPRRDVTARPGT